jgi:hypothetical protein
VHWVHWALWEHSSCYLHIPSTCCVYMCISWYQSYSKIRSRISVVCWPGPWSAPHLLGIHHTAPRSSHRRIAQAIRQDRKWWVRSDRPGAPVVQPLGGDDTADTQHKGKRASPLGLGFIQSGSLTKALEILYGLSGNLIKNPSSICFWLLSRQPVPLSVPS